MVRLISKEQPNTPNISVWPPGFDETRENGNPKRKSRGESNDSLGSGSHSPVSVASNYTSTKTSSFAWMEFLEYYLIFLLGSVIWVTSVFYLLEWHRFPYHKHKLELCGIIALPIILIMITLWVLDKWFNSNEKPQ
eukprot:gene12543-16821_t